METKTMPHLPTKLFAATLVFGVALAVGQAKAAPLPVQSALATETSASHALPVEKVHRRYRYWGWGPRYNYNYWGPRYLLPPVLLRLWPALLVCAALSLPLLVVGRETENQGPAGDPPVLLLPSEEFATRG